MTPRTPEAVVSEAQAFEQALLVNPDDGTCWRAYADYLAERDDPHGEFMQVQLSLEAGGLSKDRRQQLRARERELLSRHEREWLGELAPLVLDLDEHETLPNVRHWWGRGFLSEVRVQYLTLPLARALASAPALRFLQKFHLEDFGFAEVYQPTLLDFMSDATSGRGVVPTVPPPAPLHATATPGLSRHIAYLKLIGSPCLQNLRVLQLGRDDEQSSDGWTAPGLNTERLELLVAALPRVQELHLTCNGYDANALFGLPNLTHLQTLRVYGLGGRESEVPLGALARNPALGSLTHLLVHPQYSPDVTGVPLSQVQALVNSPHLTSLEHLQLRLSNMGDGGVRAIIESGKLEQLGWLDLRNGTITDAGAKAFADHAPTRNLRRLDLSRNRVTSAGLDLLRRAGVNAVADNSLSRREVEAIEQEERDAEME